MQAGQQKLILDKRACYLSTLILALFFFPMSMVHELGHIMICVVDGNSYDLLIGFTMATVNCDGTPSNLMLYWAFGGLLAMLVALSPLVAWNWARRNKGVLIGLLTIAAGHAGNAIVETFTHAWYVTNISFASTALVMVPAVLAFVILSLLFARKPLREIRH